MFYTFDIDVAKQYGVNEAIMIANFQFWIAKNKANNKNYFDGHYWTYNSKRAFLEMFPFWSEQNIKTILKHLKDNNIIITGNYNQNNYDHTLWYAFADEDTWLNNIKQDNISLGYIQPNDKLELTNRAVRTNQPIPDNIPDNIPDKNTDNTLMSKPEAFDAKVVELWNSIAEKYHLAKVLSISAKRHNALLLRMKELHIQDVEELFSKIRQAVKESPFLRGKQYVKTPNGEIECHNRDWICHFDFFLQPSSLLKALEGGYADPDLVQR